MQTIGHGVSVSNRIHRLEIDKSCEGKTIYIDQSDYLEELSNIKEGFKYCIDSVIDLEGFEIIVPSFGLNLHGMSSAAGLTDSTNGHSMFKSEGDGSGDVTINGLNLTQSGDDTVIFYIWAIDKFNDFTFTRNVVDASSCGVVYGYDELKEAKNLPLNYKIRFMYKDDLETYYRYAEAFN
tara:strand:- start:476 stop:1015 length:540 start_codon:yes stop_codon:yes gene_type:complete